MENAHPEIHEVAPDTQEIAQPPLALEMEDVGNLEQVLRGYYLSRIKNLEHRKDRKLARKLLENHLVLPKSRQRTSKDAAYIREILGIEGILLERLEDARLIRRLDKTGNNPIYEISHDTLVEPILAERSNREAIMRFLKKYGKYFAFLLLLLFWLGMLVENKWGLLDRSLAAESRPEALRLEAAQPVYVGTGNSRVRVQVPLSEVPAYTSHDSLTLDIGLEVNADPTWNADRRDTLHVDLGPIPVHIPLGALQALIEARRDTAIPIQLTIPIGNTAVAADGSTSPQLMARVAGTTLLRLQAERGLALAPTAAPEAGARQGAEVVKVDLGRKTVQAKATLSPVAIDTLISLADLVQDDQLAYDVLKGRQIRFTYRVDVRPAAIAPPAVDYLPVAGIEVQYPDGTRRFIPSAPGAGNQPVSHTVRAGETLYKISKLYGVPDAALRTLNNLPDNTIQVGQVLRIR